MAELNCNEKRADLSQALPTDASGLGMIHSGDLMLYGSSTVATGGSRVSAANAPAAPFSVRRATG
jgi:hypothetical protein